MKPEEAKTKTCPLIRGACATGDCHFWLWDAVRNKHEIEWPPHIPRPAVDRYEFLNERDASIALAEKARDAIRALHGTEMFGGVVVDCQPRDIRLRHIGVTVELRKTGDCCLRRAGQKSNAP